MSTELSVDRTIWRHSPEERAAWVSGNREGYPRSRRLKFWRGNRPQTQVKYQFGETFVATGLMRQGYLAWTWFWLYGKPTASDTRRRNGDEIKQLLRETGRTFAPEDILARLPDVPVLREPDVIAFHPRTKVWRFIEVKQSWDRRRSWQLVSLAANKHFLNVRAEVAQVVPNDREELQDPLHVLLSVSP